jgi:hypothetical protein
MAEGNKGTKTGQKGLLAIALEAIPPDISDRKKIAFEILSAFDVTPSSEGRYRHEPYVIVAEESGKNTYSGYSRKLGNIFLNWKNLFKLAPDIVLTGTGINSPWLIPFVALHIWNITLAETKIDISSRHAIVLLSMWQHRSEENEISEENAFTKTNIFCTQNDISIFTTDEFAKIIDELHRMKCVELKDGIIWLRESVKHKLSL